MSRSGKRPWVKQLEQMSSYPSEAHWIKTPSEWLSQAGTRDRFRETPRFENAKRTAEWDISVRRGRLSAEEVVRQAFKRPVVAKDSVRHFRSDRLMGAQYIVAATPRALADNHASIYAPVDHTADPEAARLWWENTNRVKLKELT